MSEILDEVELNQKGEIDWTAFKEFMINFLVAMGSIEIADDPEWHRKSAKLRAKLQIKHDNVIRTYTQEEISFCSNSINTHLQFDSDVQDKLPINPNNDEIFSKLDDGIILCKLLRILDSNSIAEGAIKTSPHMSVFEKRQNLKMALVAAKSYGLRIVGIDAEAFVKRTPTLILAVMW